MKEQITTTVEAKKAKLAARLLELKEAWPYQERLRWSIENGYNSESIRKLYLSGAVNSIPVAETLVKEIELYIKNNVTKAA